MNLVYNVILETTFFDRQMGIEEIEKRISNSIKISITNFTAYISYSAIKYLKWINSKVEYFMIIILDKVLEFFVPSLM